MSKKIILTILGIAVLIFVATVLINKPPIEEPPVEELVKKPEDIETVIAANNRFTLDFYAKIKDEEENIFFSPYSLSTALAMTYEGARGRTAEEMRSVFYFPEENDFRRESYLNLHNRLTREDTKHELNIANALWAQKDFPFLQEYFDIITVHYKGVIENLDFVGDPEGSRIRINKWVEEKTKEKIKDLIPQGIINSLTRLILTNAIYFKGEWVQEFNEKETKEENFYPTPEKTVKVDMMRRLDEEAEFPYYETENLQILEMPYSGEETSMLVLLPKEHNLKEVEEQLTLENLNIWQESLERQEVRVYFPKFKLETKYFLKPVLSQMGMAIVFSEAADFSGMTGEKDLMIEDVIHQAFVEVDEKGTEAAAATSVIMELNVLLDGPVIPVFRADRPFIFLIQEKETGIILFMGRVISPKESPEATVKSEENSLEAREKAEVVQPIENEPEDEDKVVEPIEDEIEIEIKEFSADKKTYGSYEEVRFSVRLLAKKDIKNVEIKITGIQPYQYAFINELKIVNLTEGENLVFLETKTPYCTSGCGGVYPGPYDIYANVFKNGRLIESARTIINLVE